MAAIRWQPRLRTRTTRFAKTLPPSAAPFTSRATAEKETSIMPTALPGIARRIMLASLLIAGLVLAAHPGHGRDHGRQRCDHRGQRQTGTLLAAARPPVPGCSRWVAEAGAGRGL